LIIVAVLLVLRLLKDNNLYESWKPITTVFVPVGILYMIMDLFQFIAVSFAKKDFAFSLFRILGIITGFIAACIAAILWWERISFYI